MWQDFISKSADYTIAQFFFLKLLAINYLIAFFSLLVQVKGLYGSHGILPLKQLLKNAREQNKKWHWLHFPSLFWLNASDTTLVGFCIAGIIAACLAIIGIPGAPVWFLLMWMLYLSYVSVDSVFLSFQWDSLLLEVGFIAIFFSMQSPPSIILLFLLWFVLFRLLFSSAVVKYLATSPEWRQLTAMQYHYETQPLPTPLAYYTHRQSKLFAQLSVIGTFIVEGLIPFFIFGSERMRAYAGICLILFQLLLAFTGNFAFFNLLTITLCILLFSNHFFDGLNQWMKLEDSPSSFSMYEFTGMIGITLIILNVIQLIGVIIPNRFSYKILQWLSPYYLVNPYGLFAHMTTHRPEIIIEGSLDGIEWRPYEFKWKPGNLKKRPSYVAPYQPRLDWQMWFAALSPCPYNPWFLHFIYRLLESSPEVLKLLKYNPFPSSAPRFIRAQLYNYQFTQVHEKHQTGDYWKRTYVGLYMRTMALHEPDDTEFY